MRIEVGRVEAIFRYPVKSMRGEPLEAATLGWHGLEGDRRLALRRIGEPGDRPWLSASKAARADPVHSEAARTGAGAPWHGHVFLVEARGDELLDLGEGP